MTSPSNSPFFQIMARRHREIETTLATWPATWVAANWSSPQMSLENWRSAIMQSSAESCIWLENVIEHLPAWGFIKWYLPENFTKTWPRIREFCPRRLFGHRARFDMYWSFLETGSSRIPPLSEWFQLTDVEQALLRDILKAEGRTIEDALCMARSIATESSLGKLIRLGFLFTDQGRVWRNDSYREKQALRAPRTRTFLVNGKKKVFHTSTQW